MSAVSFSHVSETKAFYYVRFGKLGIIVWTAHGVTNQDFEEHCHVVADSVRQLGPAPLFFNWAGGFVPSAPQRAILGQHHEAMGVNALERLAIISDSPLMRGTITAISWFVPGMHRAKSFLSTDVHVATRWLFGEECEEEKLVHQELGKGKVLVRA